MKDLIKEKIEEYDLDDNLSIVAVSGGVDSVVLLDLLVQNLSKKNVIVAHIDHGIRKESASDEIFVKKLADSHGLKYLSTKLKLTKKDEASARHGRYRWLRTVALENRAKYIITAHHLDDQLETIILNLARGAGPIDLWGMKENSNSILRPLLEVSKKDITGYAKKNKLKYVEDATNKDVEYARNRVRHTIVPEMEKINPSVKKTINKNIYLANKLSDFVNDEVEKLEKSAREENRINLKELEKGPTFLILELIKKMLWEYTGEARDVYSKNIEEVYKLIKAQGNKETQLKGITIIKDYEFLIFDVQKKTIQEKKELKVGKVVKFNGYNVRAYIGTDGAKKNNILLPSSFFDNLKVRVWRKGDKIKTVSGTKKLQDVFTDAKIPALDREKWPVVVHKNEIVWVAKLQASKYAKSTQNVVEKENKNLIVEVK